MKQHVIQRAYLEGFVDLSYKERQKPFTPYVNVFNKADKAWTKRSPEKLAAIVDYYDDPEETDIEKARVLETAIGDSIESPGIVAIRNAQHSFSSDEDCKLIAAYVGAMVCRHPTFHAQTQERMEKGYLSAAITNLKKQLDGVEDLEEYLAEWEDEDNPLPEGITKEEIINELASNTKIQYSRFAAIVLSLNEVENVATQFFNMGWVFLKTSQDRPFVTSDHAVCFYSGVPGLHFGFGGFGFQDVQITVPLSSELALLARHDLKARSRRDATDRETTAINLRTSSQAIRQIYCSSRDFPGDHFYPPKSHSLDGTEEELSGRLKAEMHLP